MCIMDGLGQGVLRGQIFNNMLSKTWPLIEYWSIISMPHTIGVVVCICIELIDIHVYQLPSVFWIEKTKVLHEIDISH